MPNTVLVTGGAGFIGSHVADAYLAAGYEVTVLDDLSTGRQENVPKRARFVRADIRSAEARELLAAGGFAILNHQAAQIDVRYSVAHPAADASVNVVGLLNLLEGARAGHVPRVVFASSGGTVYGPNAYIPTVEAALKHPASPYGAAKLAAEYYLAIFAELYGLETVALRYSNVYGPRQDSHGEAGVVAIFAGKLLAGERLIVFGDGEQTRDMVYVGDVAAANVAASRCDPAPVGELDGRAYNIGTGVETTVNKLADLVSEVVGRAPMFDHAPARPGEIRRSALAIGKAARGLAWQPKTPLLEGLRATVRSLRDH
jgi:UDP-glucose 4-epimerase